MRTAEMLGGDLMHNARNIATERSVTEVKLIQFCLLQLWFECTGRVYEVAPAIVALSRDQSSTDPLSPPSCNCERLNLPTSRSCP